MPNRGYCAELLLEVVHEESSADIQQRRNTRTIARLVKADFSLRHLRYVFTTCCLFFDGSYISPGAQDDGRG